MLQNWFGFSGLSVALDFPLVEEVEGVSADDKA